MREALYRCSECQVEVSVRWERPQMPNGQACPSCGKEMHRLGEASHVNTSISPTRDMKTIQHRRR